MGTADLHIGLCQVELYWENKELNLEKFEVLIKNASKHLDIIILPEMFTTGFTMNAPTLAEDMNGKTMNWLKRISNETNKVITGSFICKEDGKYYNRLIWIEPDGSFQYYDKKHLFRMANEDHHYSSGSDLVLIEYKGWKIRPMVCYDLRFPVWSRNKHFVVNNEAIPTYDFIYFVANWPEVRSMPWDALLRARAIENQVYCIGVNRVGKDGNEKSYNGHSAAIDPKGNYLLQPQDQTEGLFEVTLNYSELEAFRKKFPQGLDADDFSLSQ